ncbi:MAG: hypothetical protein A49_23550 [Methyloceanibacter sp.]|nr:MAG: hypothetical protein A49_23550 [Methyloceanibacter sp.]
MVLAVHRDVAGALLDPDAGDRVLPLTRGIGAALRIDLALVNALRRGRIAFALQLSQIF